MMKALVIEEAGKTGFAEMAQPVAKDGELLLKVRYVGLCGTDLNSFRGKNPLLKFPRVPGHEIAATIVESRSEDARWTVGMDVTLSPYTACGLCAACLRGRVNACEHNETLGCSEMGR